MRRVGYYHFVVIYLSGFSLFLSGLTQSNANLRQNGAENVIPARNSARWDVLRRRCRYPDHVDAEMPQTIIPAVGARRWNALPLYGC